MYDTEGNIRGSGTALCSGHVLAPWTQTRTPPSVRLKSTLSEVGFDPTPPGETVT